MNSSGFIETAAMTGHFRRRWRCWLPVVLGLLALPVFSSWSTEFRVHSYIINDQTSPVIATDGNSRFLAVWVSERQDGQLTGIFARLFSSSGVADRPEFQVNVNWEHLQEKPFVAAGPNGGYIVTWYNHNWRNISVRLFDTFGYPLTGEVIANDLSWPFKGGQAAAMDWNGGFIVVWHAYEYESGFNRVFARLFDRFGNHLGPQFQVSQDGTGDQMNPAVAMHHEGHFTVVWTRFLADGIGADIVGRQFDRSGRPLGNEFFVNMSNPGSHDQARLAMDSNGAFTVCWHAHTYTKESYNILAQRFSPLALPLGDEIIVNTFRTGWQVYPSIANGAAGSLITWQSFEQDGDGFGIFATVLDKTGASQFPEFQVNRVSKGRQESPAGVFLSANRIAVVWQDFQDDASNWDIYAAISDLDFKRQRREPVVERDILRPSKIK